MSTLITRISQLRICVANKNYFALNKTPSSKLSFNDTKKKLQLAVVRFGSNDVCTWKADYYPCNEEKLLAIERKFFGKFTQNQNGEYERRKNVDLEMLYTESNINRFP